MARNGSYVSAIIIASMVGKMQTVFQPHNKFFRRQRLEEKKKNDHNYFM